MTTLLSAVSPQLPLPWLCLALPSLTRVVSSPGVPTSVVNTVAHTAPYLAARLPRLMAGRGRTKAHLAAPAALSIPGVGQWLAAAVDPRREGGGGVLWLGNPPETARVELTADVVAMIDEVCSAVGAMTQGRCRQGLLRRGGRMIRPSGFVPGLARGASLARLLDTLCVSFEGLYPARWAIVPWVGGEAGVAHGPSLAPVTRAALEAAAQRSLAAGRRAGGAAAPHRALYHELPAVLAPLGGQVAYPHTVRNTRGEVVASLLVFDVAREQLRHRDRTILRTAANFVVMALEHQRLRRLHATSDDRYRRLPDATGHLVWFLDAAGTIRRARGWHALTGHHVPEGIEDWLCAIHPDDRAAMRLAFAALRRPGSPVASRVVECRVGAADGRYHHLRFHVLARRTVSGQPSDLLAAAWDLTHEHEAERARPGLVQECERYASRLSHEFGTPLATMAAALDVLRPTVPAEPLAQEALAVLRNSLANQAGLANNAPGAARLATGGVELRLRPLDLCALIDALTPSLSRQARQKGLTLSVRQPPERLWLNGDRDRLVQLINSLLTNAVRHTPTSGNVCLALERDGERLCLTVRDDGVGIAAHDLSRIFKPDVRGEQQDSADAGLGLHLVREVARAHGGEVEAVSGGLGHGSTVRVNLPVQAGLASQRPLAGPTQSATAAPDVAPGRPTRQVLLVEDDYGLREMLVALLAREGFTAQTAQTASEALQRAVTGPPVCAVVCDLGLPDMSGVDLLPRLRALRGYDRLPALALTGWGETRELLRTRTAGFDRHLVKPADIGAVTTWLRSVAIPGADPADARRALAPARALVSRQGTAGT